MAPMNGTQTAKNCTDPGKKSDSPLPQGIWPPDGAYVDVTARAETGALMNLGGKG